MLHEPEQSIMPWWKALRERLEETGFHIHYVEVNGPLPKLPYLIIWGAPGVPAHDTLGGATQTVKQEIHVTVVSSTVISLGAAVSRARSKLTEPLKVEGWVTSMRLTGSSPIQVDRDVVLPETNQHPVYTVETLEIVATPIKGEK